MPKYEALSRELSRRIEADRQHGSRPPVAFDDRLALRRRDVAKDRATVWRPPFVHDIDKILHCPYYNRYADKTQVFSLWKNDDISRRSLHVQLVSRISRTIGAALHLNLDLIEAIALGHDIGHPPFAHMGETYLDEVHFAHTGEHFAHNLQSVRVLDRIFPYNISLQTLNGIACHNGEIECEAYEPLPMTSFAELDDLMERCLTDPACNAALMPSTLEAAVVRLSDIIAYLGKDRQDAMRANVAEETVFTSNDIGSLNAEIINNLVVNVIENSYGKPYIKFDSTHFEALRRSKIENYQKIYHYAVAFAGLDHTVRPMMSELYGQLLDDLKQGNRTSPIFTHHIDYVNAAHYHRAIPYEATEPHRIVVDYIASMTDDYFIELHAHLFPDSPYQVRYRGYFDNDPSYEKREDHPHV